MLQFGSLDSTSVTSSGSTNLSPSSYWKTSANGNPTIAQSDHLFGKAIRITGAIGGGDYVYQKIGVDSQTIANAYYDGTTLETPLNFGLGKSRTYMVSGFAKGSQQVANESSVFALYASVVYYDGSEDYYFFDFDSDVTDWQYLSGSFTTAENKMIKEIEIECIYLDHPGTAYFDNISLYEVNDTSAARYGYYDDGNLKVMKTPAYSEYYEYEDNNLTLMANSDWDMYEYAYNDSGVLTSETYYKYTITSVDDSTLSDPKLYMYWYGPEILSDDSVHTSKQRVSKTSYTINTYGLNTSTTVAG